MVLISSAKEFYSLYKDIASKADRLRIQAKGGSMYPFIHSGDWVNAALLKEGAATLKKGDIVLFRHNGNLYIHRVMRIDGDRFTSKGDMSFGADGSISKKDILAKIVSVERDGRTIDLSSRKNVFLNSLMADVSILLQYTVKAASKISAVGGIILSRIQALKVYRVLVRSILKLEISVMEASPEDEEGLKDIYLMNGADIKNGLNRIKEEGFWLVAKINGKIAGGLTVSRSGKDPSDWIIFGLEVKPVLRGMGIGQAIVVKAIEMARKNGAKRIRLFVKIKSCPAIRLYEKLGFRAGVKMPSDFHLSEDELYLSIGVADGADTFLDMLKIEDAEKEGLFYPFYRRLIETGREGIVPGDSREKFKQIYYRYLAESAKRSQEIDNILGHLDSFGIKILLFKGPAVDHIIYDGFFRPRLDLDMVVRNEDAPAMKKALAGLGYSSDTDGSGPPAAMGHADSMVFTKKDDTAIPIHIHRHIINNTFLTDDDFLVMDMDKVWQEADHFRGYKNIFILRPEMNILYLCEHGLKHDFDQFIYLYEIKRLVENYRDRMDWEKFIRLTHEFNMGRIVYYGLYFAKKICSGGITDEVISIVKPKRFTPGEKIFIKNTLNKKRRRYSSYLVYLAAREGTLKKANFLLATIFSSRLTLKGHLERIRSILS